MGVTLNGLTLSVVGFGETCLAIAADWDGWNNTTKAYSHQTQIYGKKTVWVFECYEDGVAWANSAAKNLKAVGDSAVTLTSDLFVRIIDGASVKVLAVDVGAENEAQTIRRFNVMVQEA